MKTKTTYVTIAALLMVICVLTTLLLLPHSSRRIEGSAFVVQVDGESRIIRGMTVYLLPRDIPRSVFPELDEYIRDRIGQVQELLKDDEEFREASDSSVRRTPSDRIQVITVASTVNELVQYDPDLARRLRVRTWKTFEDKLSECALEVTKTDVDGRFSFVNLSHDAYTIVASCWWIDPNGEEVGLQWCVPVDLDAEFVSQQLYNDTALRSRN